MRRDVEFNAEGTLLRGWHYLPDGVTGPAPTIVMAHGFSAVKEMYLDAYAEVFAAAGLGPSSSTTGTLGQARASRVRRLTRERRCATTVTPSPMPELSPKLIAIALGSGGRAIAVAMS